MDDTTQGVDDSTRARTSEGNTGYARDTERAHTPPATFSVEHEGLVAAHTAEQNRLLRALPLEEYAFLLPKLTPVRLGIKHTLIEANVPIRDVYFMRVGVTSMLASEQDGGTVEVGTVGREGFIGLPVLLGADRMPYDVIVQLEGDAWRLAADAFVQVIEERPVVRRLLLRFAQTFTDQISQGVACNRLHTLEERCARRLLMTHDRVPGDAFEFRQEFLALMLGVHRPAVSVAMGSLQSEGVVRYTRGRIVVVDRARLEEASCACYHIARSAFDRLLGSMASPAVSL